MTAVAVEAVLIACVPDAIPREQRAAHFALAKRLFTELAEARGAIPGGYVLTFRADALLLIARFVDNERRCCPFIQFEIAVSADAGPVFLRMNGPDGTRSLIEAELGLDACPSSGCGCNGD